MYGNSEGEVQLNLENKDKKKHYSGWLDSWFLRHEETITLS